MCAFIAIAFPLFLSSLYYPVLTVPSPNPLFLYCFGSSLLFLIHHFDPIYTQLTNEYVLHTNDHFRSSSFRAIYNQFYLDHPIIPTILLNPVDFGRYGLYPDRLIANLGWSSLALSRACTYYTDAVYQFYTNLRLEGNLHRSKFSTFVDGHMIYVTPNLLATVIDLPRVGVSIFDRSDFFMLNFDPAATLSKWTSELYSSLVYSSISSLHD
ncbi:hypothetical protein LINPERPRIM_LOCUS12994 [Linum perenne]